MSEPTTERAVLTTAEAARILHVSDDTIKNYVNAGKLEGFRLPGGYFRIFRSSVEQLMDKPVAE